MYLMLTNFMMPMDFVINISNYASFEEIVSKLVEGMNKNNRTKKKMLKGKSIFF